MIRFFIIANMVLGAVFFVCSALQLFYAVLTLFRKPETFPPAPPVRRYAILICARNEAAVIGQLLRSVWEQDYPRELLGAFVLADNCTDNTAQVAADNGAVVFRRDDPGRIGKGYALRSLLEQMGEETLRSYDACIIIDADNLLSRDYVSRMNDCYATGRYRVITGYRNSKNYGDNWLSAGSGLCYLRDSRQLNSVRCMLGTSCGVCGTGFLIGTDVLLERGGWSWFLVLEDIEFTMDCVIRGEVIGYCHDAVLYDEQPVRFAQSWRQHIRWIRGYLQLLRHYGGRLIRGTLLGPRRLGCFDFLMSICPTYFLSLVGLALNTAAAAALAAAGEWGLLLTTMGGLLLGLYGFAFLLGAITVFTERKRIRCPGWKKLLSVFTLPLYMLTFVPETVASFFYPVEWKPIEHTDAVELSEMERRH